MAHPYAKFSQNKVAHERARAFTHRAEGGSVSAIPFSPAKTADAINRLKESGNLNHEAASDFAASRLKSFGVDPIKIIGREAKYAKGGKTHSDEAADKKLIKKMLAEHERQEMKVEGKLRHKDGHARGGKVKHKTHVQVNILNPSQKSATPPPLPLGLGAPRPAIPPMQPPGGAPPMPGGMPPGPMKRGGRVKRAEGGKLPSPQDLVTENIKRIAPSGNPDQALEDIRRKMEPPKKAGGGRVKMTGGAEGAVGRLQKAHNARVARLGR